MLSGRLIQMIEANSASIVEHVISEIRRDPELIQMRRLPDAELRERGMHVMERLGEWLSSPSNRELASYYEDTGRTRFEEGIPLHEVVHGLFLVKEKMIAFVVNQFSTKTVINLYAEEELEHRVDRFFDILVCHLIKGYEDTLRRSARAGAYA